MNGLARKNLESIVRGLLWGVGSLLAANGVDCKGVDVGEVAGAVCIIIANVSSLYHNWRESKKAG